MLWLFESIELRVVEPFPRMLSTVFVVALLVYTHADEVLTSMFWVDDGAEPTTFHDSIGAVNIGVTKVGDVNVPVVTVGFVTVAVDTVPPLIVGLVKVLFVSVSDPAIVAPLTQVKPVA
jgi:hypothetical protein